MVDVCVACDAELAEVEPACPQCGFPVTLEPDVEPNFAQMPLVAPAARDPTAPKRSADRTRAKARRPADHEIQSAAREVRYSLQLVKELGGAEEALTDVIPRAAVLDSLGRSPEAVKLLRDSQATAIARAGDLFEDHLQRLQKRQVALIMAGFDPGPLQGASRLRAEFSELPLDVVARHLLEEEHLLGRTENAWTELRTRLVVIQAMRGHGVEPGRSDRDADQEATRILGLLERQALVPGELDRALAVTQPLLVAYQKSAPSRLQGVLDAHAETIHRYPTDHPDLPHARDLHEAASRHLEDGRIADALVTIEELRIALGGAESIPIGPKVEVVTGGAVPMDIGTETARLLKRARLLAQRLKTLPPDNPLTFDAARLMRDLVGAIREDRIEEARTTLLELAHVLQAFQSSGEEI
jgi:hypothetical protein